MTAAAPAKAVTTSDPLDPLAALAAPKVETGKTDTPAAQPLSDSDIAQLLASIGVTAPSAAPAEKVQGAPPVLPELTAKLTSLATSLAATSPDLAETLKTLADKFDAAAPAQLAAIGVAPVDPDAVSIAKIVRLLLGAQATTEPGKPDAPDVDTVADATHALPVGAAPKVDLPPQLTQLLASLGVSLPTTSVASTDKSTTAATVVADITPATLSTVGKQLDALSKAIADKAPDLAQKLETVATALSAASSDPKLAAQIGAAAQQGGASLEKLVQQLVDPRPTAQVANAAAPQVAALAGVQIAKDVSVGTPKAEPKSVAIAPVSPEPIVQTTAPSIKLTAAAAPVADGILPTDGKLKDDAAVLTPAITSDKSPAPANDPAAQSTVAQPLTSPLGTAARALPAAYQPVANPINMGQVAIEMMRQVQHGSSRFTIRLDPPELGRVDVRMHVDAAGTVNARLTVERAETLDLFQRDKGSLERALSQAGVEGGKANLEFSLKQNPFAGMTGGDQRPSHGQQGGYQTARTPEDDDLTALPAITLYRGTASAGGINIFA